MGLSSAVLRGIVKIMVRPADCSVFLNRKYVFQIPSMDATWNPSLTVSLTFFFILKKKTRVYFAQYCWPMGRDARIEVTSHVRSVIGGSALER